MGAIGKGMVEGTQTKFYIDKKMPIKAGMPFR